MSRVRAAAEVDGAGLAAVLTPRDGVLAEEAEPPAAGLYRFHQGEGPLRSYTRTVRVDPHGGDRFAVTQEVEYRVGLPWFSWLFVLPFRPTLGRLHPPATSNPWWAPPERVDRRGAVVLATLCALTVVVGYLSTVLVQTMTYVGAEYHVGTAGQGVALGVLQVSAVLALVALVAADRRGRRRIIVVCASVGLVLTAASAAAPGLDWLTGVQLLAAALVGAAYLLVFVVASEEMPPGSRAWAAGLLALCYGTGSGAVLLALPLAGLGPGGWRWLFALSLLGAPIVAVCAATLPESKRFRAPGGAWSRQFSLRGLSQRHRRRLLVLGAASLAYALFVTPAGQFSNQFLRVERHFSPAGISVIQQVAGTIGAVGVVVGGRLADTRGRKPVAAVGVAAGAAVTLASFFAHSWELWLWSIAGGLLSYAVVPALSIYGPELFPTGSRSAASGVITTLGAAGGIVGLVATGALTSALGSIGPALSVMAVGPLIMVALIVVAFPETAGRGLEELNDEPPPAPGERAPARPPAPLHPREASGSSRGGPPGGSGP